MRFIIIIHITVYILVAKINSSYAVFTNQLINSKNHTMENIQQHNLFYLQPISCSAVVVNWSIGLVMCSSYNTVYLIVCHTRHTRSFTTKKREPDTSATRHFGITKLVPKFKPNHRWSCVSSELSWVEVSRFFVDHGTRVEVSWDRCRSVPECLDAEVSCGRSVW